MTKNNRQFREFLRYEVNLNQDRLQVSVRDVNRHLKGNLPGYQRIDRQGSYGLDTLVKPVNDDDEYDADIQVVMNPNPNWRAGSTWTRFAKLYPGSTTSLTKSNWAIAASP